MLTTLLFHIHTINLLYATAGLMALGATFFLFYDYCYNNSTHYTRFIAKHIWTILILTTAGGVATTLLYSEVFGFVPCSLCWLQRIALYPQAILSIVAWRAKDSIHFPLYGMSLSVFGFAIAIYQYIYQALPHEFLESGLVPCLADGTADCGKKVIEVFGFVTFPLLSAILFTFLFVLYLHMRRLLIQQQ